jgi:hypothetical protein
LAAAYFAVVGAAKAHNPEHRIKGDRNGIADDPQADGQREGLPLVSKVNDRSADARGERGLPKQTRKV